MINFLLEVTGIKWLHDRWIVNQARKRIEAEERLFQQNLKNLWLRPDDNNMVCLDCGHTKLVHGSEGRCYDHDRTVFPVKRCHCEKFVKSSIYDGGDLDERK